MQAIDISFVATYFRVVHLIQRHSLRPVTFCMALSLPKRLRFLGSVYGRFYSACVDGRLSAKVELVRRRGQLMELYGDVPRCLSIRGYVARSRQRRWVLTLTLC